MGRCIYLLDTCSADYPCGSGEKRCPGSDVCVGPEDFFSCPIPTISPCPIYSCDEGKTCYNFADQYDIFDILGVSIAVSLTIEPEVHVESQIQGMSQTQDFQGVITTSGLQSFRMHFWPTNNFNNRVLFICCIQKPTWLQVCMAACLNGNIAFVGNKDSLHRQENPTSGTSVAQIYVPLFFICCTP